MKNLIKQFTFKTPKYTLTSLVKTEGNITAHYFKFDENEGYYVGFFYNEHPLFYMHVDSLMQEFQEMTNEDDKTAKERITTIVDIIELLFRDADEAHRIANRYNIKETFARFKEAYQEILEIYEQIEDQTILNVGFPFEQSFDEIGIGEWCDNVDIMHEFAVEIINMFNLTEGN